MAYKLRCFGGLALEADGGVVPPGASRRRPLALLALAASAGSAGIPRERVLALLWPDSDEQRSRQSLKQAVYVVRRDLGADVLTAEQDLLRVDFEQLRVDVIAFETALREGRKKDAVALYTGPFLDGVHLPAAADFEHWIATERRGHADKLGTALEDLAKEASAAGELDAAVAWWRRRAALDPLSGRVALALVRALADSGDTAAALAHGKIHESLVRHELATRPIDGLVTLMAELRAAAPRPALAQPVSTEAPTPAPQIPSDENRNEDELAAPPKRESRATREPRPQSFASKNRLRGEERQRPRFGLGMATVLLSCFAVLWIAVRPLRLVGGGPTAHLTAHPFLASENDTVIAASIARLVEGRIVDEMGPLTTATGIDAPRELDGTLARAGAVLTAHAVLRGSDHAALAVADAQGTADSVGRLADRLAVMLSSRLIGEPETHVADLVSRPLPAVRSYLQGEIAYRREHFDDAQRLYRQALDRDTLLALASLGLAKAGGLGWSQHARSGRYGDQAAWRLVDRLAPTDRLLFAAYRGRPDPSSQTLAARMERWRDAYQRLPDRAEPAYEYAIALYHGGGWVGDRSAAWAIAAGLLRRAVELDSSWTSAYARLIELTAAAHDTAALAAYESRYEKLRPDPAAALYVRWRTGIALNDSARQADLRASLDTLPDGFLRRIAGLAQFDGAGLADADRASRVLLHRVDEPKARVRDLALVREYALNRGDQMLADSAIAALRALEPLPLGTLPNVVSVRQVVITDALFGGERAALGESEAKAATSHSISSMNADPGLVATSAAERCVAGLWWARTGRPEVARSLLPSIRSARSIPADQVPADAMPTLCTATLETALAVAGGSADSEQQLARLDSIAGEGPVVFGSAFVNLVLADLWSSRGDRRRALAALRRRQYAWDAGPEYLAASLAREAELALAVGDTTGARCALAHYRALHVGTLRTNSANAEFANAPSTDSAMSAAAQFSTTCR